VDVPTATPIHLYVHNSAAIDSLKTYRHAQYIKNSIWVEYRVKILPLYRLFLARYGYMQ
jgi:hypothetical protein